MTSTTGLALVVPSWRHGWGSRSKRRKMYGKAPGRCFSTAGLTIRVREH